VGRLSSSPILSSVTGHSTSVHIHSMDSIQSVERNDVTRHRPPPRLDMDKVPYSSFFLHHINNNTSSYLGTYHLNIHPVTRAS
jgi:hypothetical protein